MEMKPDDTQKPERKQQDFDVAKGGSVTGGVKIGGGSTSAGRDVNINTGGGAYIGGRVDTGGGDFVGRDQVKYVSGLSGQELESLFTPLKETIKQAPEENRQIALLMANDLEQEVAKGGQASDSRVASLIDSLVGLVPAAVSAVVSIFASPILSGVAGPVTQYVLSRIQGK